MLLIPPMKPLCTLNWMVKIFRITGLSMSPELNDGDYVLLTQLIKKPKTGDIVVVDHPLYGHLIKRVVAVNQQGDLLLQGNQPSSLSSTQMGWITQKQYLGKCVIKFRRNKHALQ